MTFTLSNPSVYSTVVKLLPIEGDTDLDFMTAKVHYMCVCVQLGGVGGGFKLGNIQCIVLWSEQHKGTLAWTELLSRWCTKSTVHVLVVSSGRNLNLDIHIKL